MKKATIPYRKTLRLSPPCSFDPVIKYWHGVFTKVALDGLKEIFAGVFYRGVEAELAGFDGKNDHVHPPAVCQPKMAVSSLINNLKGVSSGLTGKKGYPSIQKF
ncbi:transposase [uncultured Desulfovibrio sp.]|uniref:transposase n=1 Tax=uncultured Desulfovibrio sp. TaxID=167968 RepID=UPI0026260A88|nr:transposase [uncultured Desulfovibrio sp.]